MVCKIQKSAKKGGYFFENNSDFFGRGWVGWVGGWVCGWVGGGGGGGGGGGRVGRVGVGVGVPPFVRACSLELVGFRGASSEYDSRVIILTKSPSQNLEGENAVLWALLR